MKLNKQKGSIVKFGIRVIAIAAFLAISAKATYATDNREIGQPTEQGNAGQIPPAPADTGDNDVTYGPKDDGEADDSWTHPMTDAEKRAYSQTPIYPVFESAFKKCAPAGCEPLGLKTLFKTGVPRSCLLQGKSLNLGSIQCKEKDATKIYKAIDGGVFESVVKCLDNSKKFFGVKYKTGMDNIRGYRSFALISLGCNPGKDGRPKQM